MKFHRLVVFAWMSAMASVGWAQNVCAPFRAQNYAGDFPTAAAACSAALVAQRTAFGNGSDWPYRINVCSLEQGYSITQVSPNGFDGATWTGAITASACPLADCVPQVGAEHTVKNVTIGYTRTPDGNSVVGTPYNPWNPAAGGCDGTCEVTYGAALSAWTSTTPTAQGLYRQSVDMQTQRNGNSCQGMAPQFDPAPSNAPACPGAVGTVNGKPYCVGTAASPVANDKPLPPSTVPPTEGNPKAGSSPTPGEDRTPAQGGGGPEGGPRGSTGSGSGTGTGGGTVILPGAGGTGSSGTVTKPADGTEQAECGAPGQPKCSIDETGTPTKGDGKASMDNAGKALDDAEKGFKDALGTIKDQPKPEWTWSFQLPTGCSVYRLDGFDLEIDMCRWQPMIHDLMALVWISATIWFGIGIVGRTLRGGQ